MVTLKYPVRLAQAKPC
ncbi:hypothetical protein, partial [Kingella kingae]